MARKRFNPDEKALIAAAFAHGTPVEWQNVTQWHPATIETGAIVTDDGWQHVEAINLASTKTISKGQRIYVSPGHIRATQG